MIFTSIIKYLVPVLFLTAALCYWQSGFTYEALLYFIAFALYIIIGIIDFYTFTIPNIFTAMILILAVFKIIFISKVFVTENIISALFISGIFLLVNFWGLKKKGKQYIGMGDIKMIFVSFLLFDFPVSLFSLWFSSLIGLPGFYFLKKYNKKFANEKRLPFGVFLSIGFILTGLVKHQILQWLLSIAVER